ncbi:hypothetical protein P4U43_03455 [Arthrobacter sp. EH-1B-1]|uniref:Uncharacterized protein n=1 Tax=Arthrobacter vasquezii TaxID=2977629 RepID=A0ABT6CS10_9MICC|nr:MULTISPECIES: hypothetical protein [Arthrobacter]KRF08623.1 hypothetical protein ASH00_02670 [Arthrobacter sp. Soil782]MDF9276843.1 hypothetical protein [Arthrobacter vasquezii]
MGAGAELLGAGVEADGDCGSDDDGDTGEGVGADAVGVCLCVGGDVGEVETGEAAQPAASKAAETARIPADLWVLYRDNIFTTVSPQRTA